MFIYYHYYYYLEITIKGDVSSQGRNWREYNESLVKSGEMYLTFGFLESLERDLDKLNRDKLRRRFAYPRSFIELLMRIHVIFRLPYGS
jgi:hypothetical protein